MVQETGFKVPIAYPSLSRGCYFLAEKTSGAMRKMFPEENAPLSLYTNLNADVHLEVWLVCIFKSMLFVCFMSEE